MAKIGFKVEGLQNLLQSFDDIAKEIGDKKANSKILVPAVREAMQPTLLKARQLAPIDTGALTAHLQVEARRPNRRDKRSKYINASDNVIALVTTKAFPKKLKKQFNSENQNLTSAERSKKFKAFVVESGFMYDARAIAQEFGTARMKNHKPFMRPALEAASPEVLRKLTDGLARRIDSYKTKY
jgi:HK97 gp10 family phage protein